MKIQLCFAGIAIVAVCIPFRTAAGTRHLPQVGTGVKGIAAPGPLHKAKDKTTTQLLGTISRLESELAIARNRLADELRVHPNEMLNAAGNSAQPAIVSFISSTIEVSHGSSEHIRSGDLVIVLRRHGKTLTVVADGIATQVKPSFFTIKLTHNIAGVKPEDEVYLLNNPSSPYWIANIRIGNEVN